MEIATMENNNQGLQKPKNKTIICSSNPTAGFITKGGKKKKKTLILKGKYIPCS